MTTGPKSFYSLTDVGKLERYMRRDPSVPHDFEPLTCAFEAYDTCHKTKQDYVLDLYHRLQDGEDIRITHPTFEITGMVEYRKKAPQAEAPRELHAKAFRELALELVDHTNSEVLDLHNSFLHSESPNATLVRTMLLKLIKCRESLVLSEPGPASSTSA